MTLYISALIQTKNNTITNLEKLMAVIHNMHQNTLPSNHKYMM